MTRIYFVKACVVNRKFEEFSDKDKAFDYAKKIMNDDDKVFQVDIIAQDVWGG